MTRAERAMIRDALAEAASDFKAAPTDSARSQLAGMRYVARLLGMPEGHSGYEWADPGAAVADRRVRRLALIRSLPRQGWPRR